MKTQQKTPSAGSARLRIFEVMSSCASIASITGNPIEAKLGDVKTRSGVLMMRASVAMNVSNLKAEFPGVRFYVTAKKSENNALYIGCRKC